MLHEGSGATPVAPAADHGDAPKVRYTPPAQSASFAVASRVLPRSAVVLTASVAGLLGVTGLLGWAAGLTPTTDVVSAGALLLQIDRPGAIAAWWEAALWLAVAGQCLLLFGLRRHRTDDVGGSYRWWLVVAAVATGMSVASATHAHAAVATQLAAATGFSPLAGDAFWWLAPGAVAATTVGARTLLEVRECRTAGALGLAAGAAGLTAAAAAVGLVPASLASLAPWLAEPILSSLAATVAVGLTLASLLAYSRRIVLEAQGEVLPPVAKKTAERDEEEPPKEIPSIPAAKDADNQWSAGVVSPDDEDEPALRRSRPMKTKSKRDTPRNDEAEVLQSTQWVSGVEGFKEDYDDESPQRRKLTKSERKRLRREKERHAA